MKKKGLSDIVAIVIVILLVFLTASIISIKIFSITRQVAELEGSPSLTIESSRGYTYFDKYNQELHVQIKRNNGDTNLSGAYLVVSLNGNSEEFFISPEKLPKTNGEKVIVFPLGYTPDSIKLVTILNSGKTSKFISEINNVQVVNVGFDIQDVILPGEGGTSGETVPPQADPEEEPEQEKPWDYCETKKYNMAFIIVKTPEKNVTNRDLEAMDYLKNNFSLAFNLGTLGMAEMNTSYKTTVFSYPNEMPSFAQVIKRFYESNPDNFHFISIYYAYDKPYGILYHYTVRNNIHGIGWGVYDKSSSYGSNGKLLGINEMSNIKRLHWEDMPFPESLAGGLLHETGHQWCCFIGDNFERNSLKELEIIRGWIHFYQGLQSPYGGTTPMGSVNWDEVEPGIFKLLEVKRALKYHPITLYLMGLVDSSEYSKNFTVYDAGMPGQDFSYDSAVFYKNISINDIIAVEGERKCVPDLSVL